jgi:endonuclease/exonuclease/phosphatase family metal-dependent hydrolase
MHPYKIMFSNIGYAKGINGYLHQHILNANRYFYCSKNVQQKSLQQLKALITRENPDLCCLVEVDNGSLHSSYHNQLETLCDYTYRFHDIANKYGETSPLRYLPLHKGKCNAFLAKQDFPFRRLYFAHGAKRLLYHIRLHESINLFFAHFSLQEKVRAKQFQELAALIHETGGDTIILGDFNILKGFKELTPLLQAQPLTLMNREAEHTFTFHRTRLTLDLCLCSESLASKASLKIIEQPFSDHAALLLEIAR